LDGFERRHALQVVEHVEEALQQFRLRTTPRLGELGVRAPLVVAVFGGETQVAVVQGGQL
jgi:hypothetical protein